MKWKLIALVLMTLLAGCTSLMGEGAVTPSTLNTLLGDMTSTFVAELNGQMDVLSQAVEAGQVTDASMGNLLKAAASAAVEATKADLEAVVADLATAATQPGTDGGPGWLTGLLGGGGGAAALGILLRSWFLAESTKKKVAAGGGPATAT